MGKYDDLFEAAPPPAAEGKYSDLFDEPEVVVAEPQPEGGNGLVAKINAWLGGKEGVSERPSQLATDIKEAAPEGTPFVRGFGETASHVVPQSWGEVGGLAESFFPPIEAYRQIRAGIDIASGKPAPEVMPEITELKDLEDIKAQYGGDSPEYQSAAGKAAGGVLSQMIMAGVLGKSLHVPPHVPLRSEPLMPEPPPTQRMGSGTIAEDVSRALEPRPPELAAEVDPGVTQSLAQQILAQRTLTPEVVRAFAERGEPVPLEVAPEATGPMAETAVEKAMRTSSPSPLRTATELDAPSFELPDIPGVTQPPVVQQPVVPPVTPAEVKQLKVLKRHKAKSDKIGQKIHKDVEERIAVLEQKVQHGQFGKPGYTAVDTPVEAPVQAPGGVPVGEPPPPGAGDVWYHSGELPEGGEPNMPLYLHRNKEWAEGYAKPGSTTRQFKVKGKIRELQPGERDELVWNSPYGESFRQQLIKEGYVGISDPLGSPNAQLAIIDPRGLEPVKPPPPGAGAPEPYTPEAAAARAAQPEVVPQAFSEEPHVSAIANRFTAERAAAGELGEIAPGESINTMDLVHRGRKMPPEKVNESISRIMQGGDVPINDAAAIRGEEARLSQRSGDLSRAARANPSPEAQLAADNAFKDLTDFHNGPVAQAKRNWHHQGKLMQGEIPVDLSTLNGMREAWLKDTGKPPPAHVEPKLQKAADKLAKAIDEEQAAARNGGEAIERATRGRKMPTAEEVRNNIAERMKVEPCIV